MFVHNHELKTYICLFSLFVLYSFRFQIGSSFTRKKKKRNTGMFLKQAPTIESNFFKLFVQQKRWITKFCPKLRITYFCQIIFFNLTISFSVLFHFFKFLPRTNTGVISGFWKNYTFTTVLKKTQFRLQTKCGGTVYSSNLLFSIRLFGFNIFSSSEENCDGRTFCKNPWKAKKTEVQLNSQ